MNRDSYLEALKLCKSWIEEDEGRPLDDILAIEGRANERGKVAWNQQYIAMCRAVKAALSEPSGPVGEVERQLAEHALVMDRVKATLRHRVNSPWAQELLGFIKSAESRLFATPNEDKEYRDDNDA